MEGEISNSQLKAAQIPDPDGNLRGWVHFAHSFNGYEFAGSLEACAAIANGGKASSLSELRCALFFEARRDRHSGGYTDVTPTVRELLRQIKAMVEQQEQSGRSKKSSSAEPR
ncbi:hypothetical protein [Synechococcus sp. MIT S9452]|uniref:hypothetical protein n=1 Tax=Synechococcus sp. MIT S9452 TaxID=3082546 RepID=UPI0039A56573